MMIRVHGVPLETLMMLALPKLLNAISSCIGLFKTEVIHRRGP
jgi:hypothetical protein